MSAVANGILEQMKAGWSELEPYSEEAAIEVAINELLDYASERGLTAKANNEVDIECEGVTFYRGKERVGQLS